MVEVERGSNLSDEFSMVGISGSVGIGDQYRDFFGTGLRTHGPSDIRDVDFLYDGTRFEDVPLSISPGLAGFVNRE